MTDLNKFIQDQLTHPEVSREYYRLAPFSRLADQLLLLRKKRGLSQQELADKAETTQAVVSRLENASVHCALETVIRLAESLDAVVEVNIIPREEMDKNSDEDIEECDEQTEKAARKGAVFFGSKQVVCTRPSISFTFDPLTQRVRTAHETKREKQPEIA